MERDEVLLQAFAAELKSRRNKLKFSQEECAHRAKVNRTYIAKLELARNQPTLTILRNLANALEVELPELLQSGAVVPFSEVNGSELLRSFLQALLTG
jgi:transcriptional regulator with XRE-family HTH domain